MTCEVREECKSQLDLINKEKSKLPALKENRNRLEVEVICQDTLVATAAQMRKLADHHTATRVGQSTH